MKKEFLFLFCLFIGNEAFSWSIQTHEHVTQAAAQAILHPSNSSTTHLTVTVKYDMITDFFHSMFKSIGIGEVGIVCSAIGAGADLYVSADRYSIDTKMVYDDSTELSIMTRSGEDPDTFDDKTGVFGSGKVMLGHMYAPTGLGFADFMTELFYDKAVESYQKGNRMEALVYLGYASHYMIDASIPVHAEADYLNQKNLTPQWEIHSKIEKWISDNDSTLFRKTEKAAAKVPMPVCDIQATVRSMGLETYQKLSRWYKAWDVNSATPTEPKYKSEFIDLVKEQLWMCVPRVSGLFLKFKKEVNYTDKLPVIELQKVKLYKVK
jgi:hypothetical protein